MDKERRRLIAGVGAIVAGLIVAVLGWFLLSLTNRQAAPQERAELFPEAPTRSIASFQRRSGGGEGGSLFFPAEGPKEPLALLQLWDRPVAALGVRLEEEGTREPKVRFVERESGDIYEAALTRIVQRIFNTATPASQRGWFSADASALALQFLPDDAGTITTFEGPLEVLPEPDADTGSTVAFRSAPLPRNIHSFAYDPADPSRFAYLETLPGKGVRLVVQQRGKRGRELWRSRVRAWHLSWTAPEAILLVTNAQPGEEGVALSVNPDTGAVQLLRAGNTLNALLDPSGTILASSINVGGRMRLFLTNLKTGSSIDTGLSTITDKCAWSGQVLLCGVPRAGVRPANIIFWYQGGGYFDDTLVGINPDGSIRFSLDPKEYQAALDVFQLPRLQPSSIFTFIDKHTLTPWLVNRALLAQSSDTSETATATSSSQTAGSGNGQTP